MNALHPREGRCEIKFVADVSAYDSIIRWLVTNLPHFRTDHPERRVSSLYFDSYELQDYQNNMAGISRRAKLRLRWYGEAQRESVYRLEAKFRRAGIGWKTIHSVALEDLWGKSISATHNALSQQVPENFKPLLDDRPQTVLITRYDREYYISERGGMRVTIDRNIRYLDQRLSVFPSRAAVGEETDHLVVEFKFPFTERSRIRGELGGFPLRSSRSSKYVNGVKLILGNL